MNITTMTSKKFNQDVGKAKRAAIDGPVFITDRGKPAHVLLNISNYEKITDKNENIMTLLYMPEAVETDIEFPVMTNFLSKTAELS